MNIHETVTSDWRPRYWQNRETADTIQGQLAQLVECRHVNPEVAGSNPASLLGRMNKN